MGVRLPSEYQDVEWIGTTGTQIIDTDYLPVDGDEMSIEFSFTSFPGSKNYYCLAATDNSDPQVQFVFGNDSGSRTLYYKYFSTGSAKMLKTSFAVNTIYRIDVASNGDCTCNGVTVSPVNNLGYATGHMRFFARMAGNINFIGRLYTFVASHSGTEKVNLVPCYRKSDNEPGMYDLVSGEFFVNQGTGEFVVGPDVIGSISPLMVAWRRIMMAAASVAKKLTKLIATSTTGLVSFDTNVEMPTKVTCEFSPLQEGTGDPSPDNVRPISGWTGCEVYHTGKNMWWTDYTYNDPGGAIKKNGEFIAINKGGVTTTYLLGGSSENNRINFKLPKGTYSLSAYSETFSGMYLLFTDGSKWYPRTTKTFDKDMIVQAVRCNTARLAVGTYLWKIQIEQGAECTDYEPYQGETIPITFTDPTTGDPLTVYGGTVTLNEDGSADVVSEWQLIDLGNLKWVADGSRSTYYYATVPTLVSKNNNVISTCYKGINPQGIGAWRTDTRDLIIGQRSNSSIAIIDTNYRNDASGLKTSLSGQYAITLISPVIYHFPNIGQLYTFLDTNNIWHDMNGDITVEYWNKQ